MSDSWDEYAEEWDSNADVAEYSEKAFLSLKKFIKPEGLTVLDFGCGTGQLAQKIADTAASVVAVDTSPKMIDVLKAKKIPNITPMALDLSESSAKDNPAFRTGFDLIVASSVCAFLPDYGKTLLDLKALLKEGGTFVQWDWQRSTDEDDRGFTREEIIEAYSNAGLSTVEVSEAFSIGSMQVLMGVATRA